MELLTEMLTEMLTYAGDIGFLVFGLVGAVFSYRAVRQRDDEIKEKYFDRRYELYCSVDDAIKLALSPSKTIELEWWAPLTEARRRSRFLVGTQAQATIERMHDLSNDYSVALSEGNVAERVPRAMTARKALEAEFAAFRTQMEKYLAVA